MPKHFYIFPLACLVFPHASHALWKDPFRTEKKLTAYGRNLTPPDCSQTVDAALSKDRPEITVMEAVNLALCHNPDTHAAWASLRAQAASYGGAQSAWLPQASGSVGASKSASFGNNTKSSSKGTSAGVSLSYTLFDFGRREDSIEAAERSLEAAGLTYDSSLQGIIGTTLQAYYRLIASQNSVSATLESEKFAEESLQAAVSKHQLGLTAASDELQARASHAQAVLSRQQAENQLKLDRAALANLLGLGPDAALTAAELNDTELVERESFDVSHLMEIAKEQRADLASRQAQLEGSRASLAATRKATLPSVSVSAGESFSDVDVFNNDTSRSQSIGLSVSIPIFTGFSQTYSVRAAERQLEAQEYQLERAKLDVTQDVWRAYQNYETAQNTWETSFDLLASATSLRDVALGRYKAGIGTMIDVLNAQSQFASALQQQIVSRYNLLTSRADLIRATGVLRLDTARPGASFLNESAP